MPNCFQRAAGRCEAVADANGIPSELCAERRKAIRPHRVSPIQQNRVPLKDGMRVVPQRYIAPLSLVIGTKAFFI